MAQELTIPSEEPFYKAVIGDQRKACRAVRRSTFAEALAWIRDEWPYSVEDTKAKIVFFRYYRSAEDCPNREVMVIDMDGVYPC